MPETTTSPYSVPTDVLADQGAKIARLYAEDKDEHKTKLASVGLGADTFVTIGEIANEMLELEVTQEERKEGTRQESLQATAAAQEVLTWRAEEVLTRARVVFAGDNRLKEFRPGQLRSVRTGFVIVEGERLIKAIKRFDRLPAARAIGLDLALAEKGEALLAKLKAEGHDDDISLELQRETTNELRDMEGELAKMLGDVEERMTIAFGSKHPARRRYRMNDIRTYVARQRGKNATDPSANVSVPDPIPSDVLEPEDA